MAGTGAQIIGTVHDLIIFEASDGVGKGSRCDSQGDYDSEMRKLILPELRLKCRLQLVRPGQKSR